MTDQTSENLILPSQDDFVHTSHNMKITRAPIEGAFHVECNCGWERYHDYGTDFDELWRAHDARDRGNPE